MDLGHPLEFGTFITPLNSQGVGDALAPVRLAQLSGHV